MSFISFCCLIADARTSNTTLNNSGETGHPCRVPDLKGTALSFSPSRMILAVGFSSMAFMMFKYVPSILTFSRVFIKKGCWILSNDFFLHWLTGSCGSYLLLMWCITLIDLRMLNQPCIPGMNPTWSWWIILFICCWIWFASILLRIVASIFIRDIGL